MHRRHPGHHNRFAEKRSPDGPEGLSPSHPAPCLLFLAHHLRLRLFSCLISLLPFLMTNEESRLPNFGLSSNIGQGLFVGWVGHPVFFVGFRSSTQPTCQPLSCYQRKPTKWPKIELSPEFRVKEYFQFHFESLCLGGRSIQFVRVGLYKCNHSPRLPQGIF
jgi:hypothetical protein